MLKLVGTEHGKIVDEKVILDDNDKPTQFALKLVVLDVILDVCLFTIFYSIVKSIKK